eukprot:jgi/Bigna1/137327/aug1.38_g12035
MEKNDMEKALNAQGIDIDNVMIEECEPKKSKKIPNSKPKIQKVNPASRTPGKRPNSYSILVVFGAMAYRAHLKNKHNAQVRFFSAGNE